MGLYLVTMGLSADHKTKTKSALFIYNVWIGFIFQNDYSFFNFPVNSLHAMLVLVSDLRCL